MRSAVFALAVCEGLAGTCCWSKWGDASSCGNYPAGGTGPICGNDGVTVCQNNADCDNPAPPSPTPTPTPTPPTPPRGDRGVELLGYLENWGPAIKWWDENMPGNCLMGCFKNDELLNIMKSYTALNYGFSGTAAAAGPSREGAGVGGGQGSWGSSAQHAV